MSHTASFGVNQNGPDAFNRAVTDVYGATAAGTGDGADMTLTMTTTVRDPLSQFSTSTYTALDSKYHDISLRLALDEVGAGADLLRVWIAVSDGTEYNLIFINAVGTLAATGDEVHLHFRDLIPLRAGQSFTVKVNVTGNGGDTITALGTATGTRLRVTATPLFY